MLLVQGRLQRAGVGVLHHLCPDRFHCPAGDGREHRTGQPLPHLTYGHSLFPRADPSTPSASHRHRDAISTQPSWSPASRVWMCCKETTTLPEAELCPWHSIIKCWWTLECTNLILPSLPGGPASTVPIGWTKKLSLTHYLPISGSQLTSLSYLMQVMLVWRYKIICNHIWLMRSNQDRGEEREVLPW